MSIRHPYRLFAVLAILFLSSCSTIDTSISNLVDGLEARQVKGCYDTVITITAGGGLGLGASGSAHMQGLIVTGGMTPKECRQYRDGE